MVVKTKLYSKQRASSGPSAEEVIVVRAKHADNRTAAARVSRSRHSARSSSSSVDVIDLGAPRRLRRAPAAPLPGAPRRSPRGSRVYTPNPRLYPGPAGAAAAAAKPKRRRKREEARGARGGRARRRVFRRPVPNARLYRPAPRRPPPPQARPRGPWPPPASPASALDTASRVALRLLAHRRPGLARAASPPSPPPRQPAPPRSRRLVVTLPPAAAAMDAGTRHSTSPEDCSEANDSLSAPSEFLAEFLSAIMRRQYAEALKYCRLILQYEPHNATARGFYPLLQHKLKTHHTAGGVGAGAGGGGGGGWRRGSDSSGSRASSASRSGSRSPPMVEASGRSVCGVESAGGCESEGSVASQSSLELDSSSGAGPGSGAGPDSSAGPGSGAGTGSARSDDTSDDNGNPRLARPPRSDDLENDNDIPPLKSDSTTTLQRLRAQFTCSIK